MRTALASILIANLAIAAPSTPSPDAANSPVVIVATFAPDVLQCEVSFDPDVSGIGQWSMDAPCQQFTSNPLAPLCWKEPEDKCVTISDQSWDTLKGDCPEQPCILDYEFTMNYDEVCENWGCPPLCCTSGIMRVTRGASIIGYFYEGIPEALYDTQDCACQRSGDSDCSMTLVVACSGVAGYWHQVFFFGYNWQCLECE